MISYDLLIIGSGPAGQRAAIYANKLGKRAAVVEKMRTVGGVSVNTGTIPSKTMREAVLHLSGYNYRSVYGMNYRVKEKITMADLAFRVQHVIKTEIDVTEAQLSRNGIDVLAGVASFEDSTHVKVTNESGTTVYEAKTVSYTHLSRIVLLGMVPVFTETPPTLRIFSTTAARLPNLLA